MTWPYLRPSLFRFHLYLSDVVRIWNEWCLPYVNSEEFARHSRRCDRFILVLSPSQITRARARVSSPSTTPNPDRILAVMSGREVDFTEAYDFAVGLQGNV